MVVETLMPNSGERRDTMCAKPLGSLAVSVWWLVSTMTRMVQTMWTRVALPLSGTLVVVKHSIGEEQLEEMPRLADLVVLSPFFFGLFFMESVHKRRRQEVADCSWGAPIYYLCL
jgi:hypothetical protein